MRFWNCYGCRELMLMSKLNLVEIECGCGEFGCLRKVTLCQNCEIQRKADEMAEELNPRSWSIASLLNSRHKGGKL